MKIDANDFARENSAEKLKKELERMERETPPIKSASTKTEASWPAPLHRDAFYGLAGKIIRTIEPHTEADEAALLVHLLVAFGNRIGRNSFLLHGEIVHRSNLFCVFVGASSNARKGTAWEAIKRNHGKWTPPPLICGDGTTPG